jgi:hypothetical protein
MGRDLKAGSPEQETGALPTRPPLPVQSLLIQHCKPPPHTHTHTHTSPVAEVEMELHQNLGITLDLANSEV